MGKSILPKRTGTSWKTHRDIMERLLGKNPSGALPIFLTTARRPFSVKALRGYLRYLRHNGPGKRLVHDKKRMALPLPCMI